MIFLTAFGLFLFTLHYADVFENKIDNLRLAFVIGAGLIAVVIISYLVKSSEMSKQSINTLAKILNASEILNFNNLNLQEQTLLNIVNEMAIASSVNMPRVFILRYENGINAMCSGENFGDYDERIAIFVTQGALETFSRDELQGVIGHEFSHAHHGDAQLNLKLFSIIFSLTFIMIVGEFIFRWAFKGSRTKSKDGLSIIILMIFFSLIFFFLGFISSIFAGILKSAISRQKELLADVSSVQYTRNVSGIKSALIKIRNLEKAKISNTKIENPNAKLCSHMFFLSAFDSIFATHPSLDKRIKLLSKIGL